MYIYIYIYIYICIYIYIYIYIYKQAATSEGGSERGWQLRRARLVVLEGALAKLDTGGGSDSAWDAAPAERERRRLLCEN